MAAIVLNYAAKPPERRLPAGDSWAILPDDHPEFRERVRIANLIAGPTFYLTLIGVVLLSVWKSPLWASY
jgi:hypothetical protein